MMTFNKSLIVSFPDPEGRFVREEIITCARSMCTLCGATGTRLYEDLRDELFGAPGSWGFMRCTNSKCGLIWLDPAPLASELHKAYLTYYTHSKDQLLKPSNSVGWFRAKVEGLYGHLVHHSGLLDARRRLLARHLDGMEPGRLLEIGCGDGSLLSAFQGCGWKVAGVDSDPQAAQAAMKKFGIVVQIGRFEDCDFFREQFDVIVMNHVIEHVLDPVKLFISCANILKKQGVLLLVTPNIAGLGHVVFRRNWMGLDPPRHLHLFSPGVLAKTVQRANLRCVHLSTTSVNSEAFFWGSTHLRGQGNCESNLPTLRLLFLSWFYQYYSLLRNLWNSEGGEEIVMVCRKSSQLSTTD